MKSCASCARQVNVDACRARVLSAECCSCSVASYRRDADDTAERETREGVVVSTLLSGLAEYLDVLCVSGSGGEPPPAPSEQRSFSIFSRVFFESGCRNPVEPGPRSRSRSRIRDFVYIDITYIVSGAPPPRPPSNPIPHPIKDHRHACPITHADRFRSARIRRISSFVIRVSADDTRFFSIDPFRDSDTFRFSLYTYTIHCATNTRTNTVLTVIEQKPPQCKCSLQIVRADRRGCV